MRKEVIGDCTLYEGDCLDVLPTLGAVDAVVTDPPYCVGFQGKVSKHKDHRGKLSTYSDDESTFGDVVLPAIKVCLSLANRMAVMPGTYKMQSYPTAKDIGGIVCPNGGGRSSWGFGCYHPILYYGSSPYNGGRPTATVQYHPGMHVTKEVFDHPCPKPISFMLWLVERASLRDEIILDPFMGSGTTGVACVNLGRKFIGIEKEPKYFDIACKRIDEATRQGRLFEESAQKPEQLAIL